MNPESRSFAAGVVGVVIATLVMQIGQGLRVPSTAEPIVVAEPAPEPVAATPTPEKLAIEKDLAAEEEARLQRRAEREALRTAWEQACIDDQGALVTSLEFIKKDHPVSVVVGCVLPAGVMAPSGSMAAK